MEYFIGAYKKYADFNGRARRKEYWMFVLFYMLIYIVALVASTILAFVAGTLGMIVMLAFVVFALATLIPTLSITARRLHDIGRSGWWQLLHLTGVGSIVIFIFTLFDSVEDNEFGPNPKA